MKALDIIELESIFGGSPESYDAGKSHGKAFREALDNCAAIGLVVLIITRGKVKLL